MDVYFGNSILEAKKMKYTRYIFIFIYLKIVLDFGKKHTQRWLKLLKNSTIRNCWKSVRGLIKLQRKKFFKLRGK